MTVRLGLTRSLALAPFGPKGRNRWFSPWHRGGFATPGADTAAVPSLAFCGRAGWSSVVAL